MPGELDQPVVQVQLWHVPRKTRAGAVNASATAHAATVLGLLERLLDTAALPPANRAAAAVSTAVHG